jgi:hypothetical protein
MPITEERVAMPLPAYMTQQPKTEPVEVLARRISNLSQSGTIVRAGQTITVRALDCATPDEYRRAIRMMCEQADAMRYSVEANVPSVLGDSVKHFEHAGFQIAHETGSDDEDGAHFVLRRRARR